MWTGCPWKKGSTGVSAGGPWHSWCIATNTVLLLCAVYTATVHLTHIVRGLSLPLLEVVLCTYIVLAQVGSTGPRARAAGYDPGGFHAVRGNPRRSTAVHGSPLRPIAAHRSSSQPIAAHRSPLQPTQRRAGNRHDPSFQVAADPSWSSLLLRP